MLLAPQKFGSLLCTRGLLTGGEKEGHPAADAADAADAREGSWRSVLELSAAKVNSTCGAIKQIPSLRDTRFHKARFRGTHGQGRGVIPP